MRRLRPAMTLLLLGVLLAWAGVTPAQAGQNQINRLLVKSYDLLEAGKLDQARAVFAQILKQDPGNPLALNNLGAVLVKQKKYEEALKYLEQARLRARGYQVKINRVCDAEQLCLAFRPAQEVYGNMELLPLIDLNIQMVQARLATKK
jgi:tetratricopeptide (TPR) repeat protein